MWSIARAAGLTSSSVQGCDDDVTAARRILYHVTGRCDVTAVNASGVSALHLAAWYGFADLAAALVQAGCDVSGCCDDRYKRRWLLSDAGRTLFSSDCDLYASDGFCVGRDITALYLASRFVQVTQKKRGIESTKNRNHRRIAAEPAEHLHIPFLLILQTPISTPLHRLG